MTQNELVTRLKKGWLSSADWFREHGSLKLTSRISDLRAAGVDVLARSVKRNGKSFNEYRLAK